MRSPLLDRRRPRAVLCAGALLALAAAASAFQGGQGANEKPAPAGQGFAQVSRSAEQELQQSIQELNRLRDQIAAEKLPLAQELTELEEKLSGLRKEHERITRLVDEQNLAITGVQAGLHARTEELTYTANLLDEYARTFESKIDPSELQYCGQALADAKQAGENTALSRDEKFARQTGFVELSLQRMSDAIGGMRFPGQAVDLTGAVVQGQFALIGPVALFRAASGVAGLVVPQSGSVNPLVRPLEGALQAGLAELVQSGEGTLPLDPMRGAALKALVQKTNLYQIFRKGGPIMWPLLCAAILALGTVLERVFFLLNERRKRDPQALERLLADVERGDVQGALRDSAGSKDYVVRVLRYALEHREQSLPSALLYAQSQELKRFQRGISVLDTVITLAPLLGLLGTVTGMMGSFSLIGGELSAPGAITGGIAEALIATAFGLGIAITALLPFNVLNTRLDVAKQEIDAAASQLELLVHPQLAALVQAPPTNHHDSAHNNGGAPAVERQPVGAGAAKV